MTKEQAIERMQNIGGSWMSPVVVTFDEARKAYNKALAELERNPCPETSAAATAAHALMTSTPKPIKRAAFASRAGKRQAAERRSLQGRR